MERIEIALEGREQRDGLRQFYEACLDAAQSDGCDKIASICLRVRHVDPLAVLDSIYEKDAEHFYLENSQRCWAIAGAEAIAGRDLRGAERFAQARAFAREWDAHIIAIGDSQLPLAGPLFFVTLPFFAEGSDEEPNGLTTGCGRIFIPTWQVARRGGDYIAVANARIAPDTDIEPLVERLWAAHARFRAESYQGPESPQAGELLSTREVGPENGFANNVRSALGAIADGRYEKIVLARAQDLEFAGALRPLQVVHRLRQRFPACYAFSHQDPAGRSFIGATPERLIAIENGRFYTEAIAGSAPRAGNPQEDAYLARALLESNKDLREHQFVIDSIVRRLGGLGIIPEPLRAPELLQLANVQHLRTPIEGALPADRHLLDLAAVLHPTPALGGVPRENALADIRALEPFERGLFGGLLGWFDPLGNGEFAVGIRSAALRGNRARLFAGAGIVAGSDPERELAETVMKMNALLEAITAISR